MSLRVIAVGRIKEPYLQTGINEYLKRINHWQKTEIAEVKDNKTADKAESAIKEEGERVLRKVRQDSFVVILTPEGNIFSSEELAKEIEYVLGRSKGRIDIIIGGYEGLCPEVKQRADLLLSLSRLTFSSQMARLILMEQLFRCMKIIKGEPYHR